MTYSLYPHQDPSHKAGNWSELPTGSNELRVTAPSTTSAMFKDLFKWRFNTVRRLEEVWPMSAAGSFMFERKEIPAELTSWLHRTTGSLQILIVAWLQSGGGTSELVVSHKGTAIVFYKNPYIHNCVQGRPVSSPLDHRWVQVPPDRS
jgi:hypothetical protein